MDTNVCILDADYILDSGNRPVVRLWCIDKNGKSVLVEDRSFKPYFYIEPIPKLRKNEMDDLESRILRLNVDGFSPEKVELVEKTLLGSPVTVLKVTVTRPPDVPKFRELVKEWSFVRQEYEYGISFHRRYLIDNDFTPMRWIKVTGPVVSRDVQADLILKAESIEKSEGESPPLHILAFDFEIAEEGGEEKIIMASLKDNKGFDEVITYKRTKAKGVKFARDEGELIRFFIETVKKVDPHVICGYNTDSFDFLKLVERANKNRIELILGRDRKPAFFRKRGRFSTAKLNGRIHIDLYTFIRNVLSQNLKSEVLTLDRVAKEMLGIGKLENLKWDEIEEAWKSKRGINKIVEYCRWDSVLALKLAYRLMPQIIELSKVTGQTLFDVSRMTYSQMVEWTLIKKAFQSKEIAYSRPKYAEVQRRRETTPYAGGYVHTPTEGIYDKIALLDFRSLYPSIIVSHNISPDTLDCRHRDCNKNKVPELKHCFCTQAPGFIPKILENLIEMRRDVNKKMDQMPRPENYKELHNRQFALKILANAFYGYFGYAGSRWYSRVCARSITAWGRYYIKKLIEMAEEEGFNVLYGDTDSMFLKITNKKMIKPFLTKVNKSLPGIMELEFKGYFERGMFIETKTGTAAKKKYALVDENGKLVIRGLEIRRRDWSKIAKDTQEKVLMAILKENSKEKAVDIVKETIKKLKRGKVDFDELTIYTQLTKPLSQYEQIGPHVKAARKSIERGRHLGEGSIVAYIVTKGSGTISDRSEPAEDAENYDTDYYISRQVIPAAMRILSGLGVEEDDLLGKGKISSLKGFFGKK